MKTNIKNKRGISLIVLIITIIVMIILASAVILQLTDNKVIEKANKAKNSTDDATAKEIVATAYAKWSYSERQIKKEDSSIKTFSDYAKKKLQEAGLSTEGVGSYEVGEDGKLYVYPVIPDGFVVSDIEGENTLSGGLVIYEGTEKVSTDTDAKTTRNQFVWVPVPSITEFVREDGYSNGVKQNFVSSGETTEPFSKEYQTGKKLSLTNDLTGEWAEYSAMRASVEKYGGFYIGRYEGHDFRVPWGSSMINIGSNCAVSWSRNLYASNSSVVSTLIYGEQWDAAIRFISKTYPTFAKDSSDYGCYMHDKNGNEIPEYTEHGYTVPGGGGPTLVGACNIYDMAGNALEWTMEAYGTDKRVLRGGCIFDNGVSAPASYRCVAEPDDFCASSPGSSRGGLCLSYSSIPKIT